MQFLLQFCISDRVINSPYDVCYDMYVLLIYGHLQSSMLYM